MSNIRFIHLRYGNLLDGRLEAKGGVTIGFARDGNEVRYTVATCTREDHYNKSIGRAITTGRLAKGKNVVQLILDPEKPTVESIIAHALADA